MMTVLLIILTALLILGEILTYISKMDKDETSPQTLPQQPFLGDRVIFNKDYCKYDIVIRKGTKATLTDSDSKLIYISIDGMPFEMMVDLSYLDKDC